MKKINISKKYYKRVYINIPEDKMEKFLVSIFGYSMQSYYFSLFPVNKNTLFVWIKTEENELGRKERLMIYYNYYINLKTRSATGGGNYLNAKIINWLVKNKIIEIIK